MTTVVLYSFASVIVISLVSLIGVFTLSLSERVLGKILIYMISFAAGGLLGDAFIHLLPEAVEESGFTLNISLYFLIGISVSFIMEKIIRWRHCHHPTTDAHPHPVAMMNLFGDAVHNFVDGLVIGASYLVSIPVGVATTVAVVLHEIPQEIGDFGILLHGGMSKRRALFLNFATALTAVLGVAVALGLNSYVEDLTLFLIPFAAGGFVYIAVADLIPELHKEVAVGRSLLQFFFFALGIALMLGMLLAD
ncbi:MAG: ZIP family metal transporter [Candidatus Gracilibacteria bacterium]